MSNNIQEAIERLKRIDIKFFLSGMNEQSNYIVDEADKTNKAIETVLNYIETLEKENKEIRIKNNAIKQESEAYAERMISLDNELNLEKEKSKYYIENSILTEVIEEKITDIENASKMTDKENWKYIYQIQKNILQELLENK